MTERKQATEGHCICFELKDQDPSRTYKGFFQFEMTPIILHKWPKNVLLLTIDQIYIQHVYSTLYLLSVHM